MYSQSFTLLRLFVCTATFITIGKRGVFKNSNFPSIAVCADIVGFSWQGLSIFKVIVACGMSPQHRCIGKQVSVLTSPAMK